MKASFAAGRWLLALLVLAGCAGELNTPGEALRVLGGNLPDAYLGEPYEQPISVAGGLRPYSYEISGGELPAGLALEGANLRGVPGELGTFTFNVTASDANLSSSVLEHRLRVVELPPPALDIVMPETETRAPFTIRVHVEEARDLKGLRTRLRWDPALFSYVDGSLNSPGTNYALFSETGDDWLQVETIHPDGGEVGPRPEVRMEFNTYIEDDRLLDYGVATLESGGLRVSGRVEYEMTTRSLVFRPLRDLVPGLIYTMSLRADFLRSVTGAPFRATRLPRFVPVEDAVGPGPTPIPRATWSEIDAVLERKCRSCHADPTWDINPLTRASLVGVPSEQTDATLVVPYDPGDSYLMHKILPDYPVRRFTVQPPPWSGAQPLTTGEQRLFELWIRDGAR